MFDTKTLTRLDIEFKKVNKNIEIYSLKLMIHRMYQKNHLIFLS